MIYRWGIWYTRGGVYDELIGVCHKLDAVFDDLEIYVMN